ncbi:hypothetical protein [Natronoglycomyces albus]|uniref:Uncharacterized protein n=1 Tax=Natronoglycomyces albus TaxID=2811108 RepID=A0A895XFU0_9ACTN|nr:hypothetical protein [Natronoglycomyces albus]QSB04194.1 hypothetical protein JQS30_10255 [Natronoglycomyces albus]
MVPLFGSSKPAADCIIENLDLKPTSRMRKRFASGTMLIVVGTLVTI